MREQLNSNNSNVNINILEAANSKTSCVAWFKLADLITRKEKEKALNLYRLLSHSFDDRAYALQVEGDILWALEDEVAVDKYKQAAYLYKKEKKLVAATAVYEHLLTLQPNNYDFLSTLIILYILLSWSDKFEERYQALLDRLDQAIISEEQVLDFSKKIIDFAKGANALLDEDAQEAVGIQTENYDWLLKSLQNILKNRNSDLLNKLKISA
jgi:hypothetical protein